MKERIKLFERRIHAIEEEFMYNAYEENTYTKVSVETIG